VSSTIVVIPARIGSTRLPRKALRLLGGVPVVEWCRRAAVESGVGRVVVATDHCDIADAVRARGGEAVLTPPDCPSGTDRVHAAVEALEKAGSGRLRCILNLQGDEPFIGPETLRGVADLLSHGAAMSTAVAPLADGDLANPDVVKAVVASTGRCLYFSRAPVPYLRPRADAGPPPRPERWRHVGVYGFSRKALDRFVKLPPSPLEGVESLEQLRALEEGIPIFAFKSGDRALSIDTEEDLGRASRALSQGLIRSFHG
jgi:3-deoxy-manno-octulosonate cytidylyltransferase (CMP-KDO synthetase)